MNQGARRLLREEQTAGLSPAKRELLALRLSGRPSGGNAIPARPPAENPLSFGQERLWFQTQVTKNDALYNIAFLAHIDGPLDAVALEASLDKIIARHEILRASFTSRDGAPVQDFASSVGFRLAHVDLRGYDHLAQREALAAQAGEEARRPFDLGAPPLLRAVVFECGPSRFSLLFVVHHLVWDGWSSGVLIEEIARLYDALRKGQPDPLPPLSAQYADFAYWHRRLMAGDEGERQLDYWRERLAGLPGLIALPTDRARATRQNHRGAVYSWKLSKETLDGLTALALKEGATLFAVLLSAFDTLLMHYSGERDIAVGTTIAYRTRPELERLVGFFANALVMRAQMHDDPSFATLVSRMQLTSIEAQSNQDAPFDMLVDKLGAMRGLSHNPLFQVAFVLHNIAIKALEISDLTVNFEDVGTGAATFDLVFHIYNESPGLKASLEYDAELFDATTIERMATHLDAVIACALADPTQRISTFSLLSPDEEARAVIESRAPLAACASPHLLHALIERRDDGIAVACGSDSLSYEALAVRSNQLAHHLQALGCGPDAPVGVLLEPGVDLAAAIVGVLKAGGAYVPIDPAYPPSRIAHILADSKAKILVTNSALISGVEATPLLLDAHAAAIAAQPTGAPESTVGADNLAYIIYTSGSTGLAKGVMVSHRNAVASTRAREQFYRDPVGGFLLLSSIAFDSSAAGFFWTLAQGGRLHIASEALRRDPGALANVIVTSAISHVLCLPSLHRALLDVLQTAECSALRCCIVAGEECRRDVALRHFEKLPDVALYNEYGPTECSVWSTAHEITPHEDASRPISIGRAVPGAQVLVLGAGGALLPRGVPGEAHIGGEGVARGYVGRPDLTAERFIPNPFGRPGERLYRTGDRVRIGADRRLEFLGRFDDQIKLRGYRVDPQEIEGALATHPDVAEAVVVVKKSEHGQARLVAYVGSAAGSPADIDALKRHLAERLPLFMAPDAILALAEIPRLPNGKIDKNALPEPASASAKAGAPQPFSSAIELLLGEIWRDVLGVEAVRGHDNFFDLGGNSLAAIQVVARAQQLFGKEIPVSAIFEGSDLAAVAAAIQAQVRLDVDDDVDALLAEIESSPANV